MRHAVFLAADTLPCVLIWFVLALVLNSEIFYNCEANDLGAVWSSYNERTNLLSVYRCFLTNRLHNKAAELCLANSGNNRVTTTKYMSTIIASTARVHACHSLLFLLRGIGKILL